MIYHYLSKMRVCLISEYNFKLLTKNEIFCIHVCIVHVFYKNRIKKKRMYIHNVFKVQTTFKTKKKKKCFTKIHIFIPLNKYLKK